MPSEISELTVFHCVVRHASYARAADELMLSPSGISRIISRMEERLGARLVQRTTRKLSLTEAGAAFHARTAQVLLDLADAESFVQETAVRPRGNLRVTAPVVFGQLYVAPLLGDLLRRFPDLSIDLSLTDRMVDLIEEGVDLAIRIGQLTDSRLIARRLCQNHRVLVASSKYFVGRPLPTHPSQLAEHECILFTGFTRPREWKLIGPEGPVSVGVSGRVASNNVDTLTAAAKQGLGITFGATLSAGPALLSGELVRVLPDYEFEPTSIFALYPSARQLSPKVRAVVDFLVANLVDPPSWDRLLAGKVPGFPAAASSGAPQGRGGRRRRAGSGRASPRPGV
ncbi:MAG TPA: LysR family transcriptional regulator [Polyangia bacterium]|nr:LysR family transcriptional regulator [Polyangia bacterium]